jgi:flagellar hook-basal body complex protein FliE
MASPIGTFGSAAPAIVVSPQGISPQTAARAYRDVDSSAGAAQSGALAGDFGSLISRALEGAVQVGHQAEAQATQALSGGGNLTDVVQAVSRAELALQTTTAIRDRVVQAYQDIMKMPI